MQNHQTSGALFLHLYFHPPILSFKNLIIPFFLPSSFFSFPYHHSCIHHFFHMYLFMQKKNQNKKHDLPHVYMSIYTSPTLFPFSSPCSTNLMIRLENIVFLFGSKVLQIVYTKKKVIIFNSGSKGFTKWIIHKVGLLVKQLTLMPLSSLCNHTYQCRLKQI